MYKQSSTATPKVNTPTRNISKFRRHQSHQNTPVHNLSDSSISRINRSLSMPDNTSLPSLSSNNTPILYRTHTPTSLFQPTVETPECYNAVTLETPKTKDRYGKVAKLNVAVRIRPLNNRELNTTGVTNAVHISGKELKVITSSSDQSTEISHCFQYDNILWSCNPNDEMFVGQEEVYTTVGQPLLDEAFEGYNTCLFAYGQTGSGKSYSMMGTELLLSHLLKIENNTGIIPRFCFELFNRINMLDPNLKAIVDISYFEIYNEKIHDLLSSPSDGNTRSMPLKVREHPILGPYVVDLSVHPINSYNTLCDWLIVGNKQRATASTIMNDKSSRSHSIFTIVLSVSGNKDGNDAISRRSKINLVDLAGSERLGNVQNTDERLKQGVSINKSLLTLGKVIAALAEQKRTTHIPYRESVLTWLLRESLGGNSRTSMLATITPASCHVDETLSTLRYASQARTIVNRMRVNEDPQNKLIRELKAEVERLRALRENYERRSLNNLSLNLDYEPQTVNLDTRIEQNAENTNPDHQYNIENRNGEVLLHVLRGTSSFIENDICISSGERLVIHGGYSFKIEKMEDFTENDIENDINNLNVTERNINLDDLDNSIMILEQYQNELESKNKTNSTPDTPNMSPPYHSNFLEELENVLTTKNTPLVSNFISPRIKMIFNKSPVKKSIQKYGTEKHLIQLKETSRNLKDIFKTDENATEALKNLNSAIEAIDNICKLKKPNKSVKFL